MTSWVLMLTLNGREMTREAINSCLRMEDAGKVKVLVVDDGSTDGTVEMLKAFWPDVVYVTNFPPRGVSYGWNRGLRLVFDHDDEAKQVLVVNNDIELHPMTYRYLLDANLPFVTCVSVREKERLTGEKPSYAANRPHPDFSCFMITRECYEKVGPFDEQFEGGYVEDGDYHLRMHYAGVEAQCIDFPFVHHASGAINNSPKELAESIRKKADRNRQLFAVKWGFQMGSEEYYQCFTSPGGS